MDRPRRRVIDSRGFPSDDRFNAIMAACEELRPGSALELIVDHDPLCMYYTLKATYGDEAFRFVYMEEGPQVWRIEIARSLTCWSIGVRRTGLAVASVL